MVVLPAILLVRHDNRPKNIEDKVSSLVEIMSHRTLLVK